MYYTVMKSRLCDILLAGDEKGLQIAHLETGQGKRQVEIDPSWERNDRHFEDVVDQLRDYFAGKRTSFDLKLNPQGTEFQKKVWQALQQIPYGQTVTYKALAVQVGNEKASRAVGSANGKNPIPIIIPCHRVIGANGALTGFAHGVKAKQALLDHEIMGRLI